MVECNKKIGKKIKERNSKLTEEERLKIYSHEHTEETKKKISEASKKMWENDPERNLIKKVIKKRSENGWHSNKGLKYPYKFKWITNGKKDTRIKETDEIPEGWYEGRTAIIKNIWISNGKISKQIKEADEVPEGWYKCRK